MRIGSTMLTSTEHRLLTYLHRAFRLHTNLSNDEGTIKDVVTHHESLRSTPVSEDAERHELPDGDACQAVGMSQNRVVFVSFTCA